MKIKSPILLCFCLIALTLVGCHGKKNKNEAKPVPLNQQTVAALADSIARSVVSGNPNVYNDAIDRAYIKQKVSENSIVSSGFDVKGGKELFEQCLQLGNQAVAAIENGGDFTVSNCYVKDKKYHIVFRTYNDYTVDFVDFVVDTVKGKLKLKDGFIYSKGCSLSKDVESRMLFELMLLTNPDAEMHWLKDAADLSQQKQYAQSLAMLKEHREALQEYAQYNQFYIANLSQTSKNFIADMDAMKGQIDNRTLLLHKLLYLVNVEQSGKAATALSQTEQTINALIDDCGDDPVFLFLYGVKMIDDNPADALKHFQMVEKSMPFIWDLWMSELKCYNQLKDAEGLDVCLAKGKELYGLDDTELADIKGHLQK